MARYTRLLAAALGVALVAATAACSSNAGADGGRMVRLGYFPNLTHAAAFVGVADDLFEANLPEGVTLADPQIFGAGPEAVEALFSDALDITYIGPSPAINAYVQSGGEAIRIIAGATSGGASLVVRKGIKGPEGLKGKTLGTPQLGNTQDVALRAWLKEHGLSTTLEGGGDVSISPVGNSAILEGFAAGSIDGAWVPEPYATRLVQEQGAKILVDEADLWPGGRFVTTHIVVRTAFLESNPDIVKGLLVAHLAATTVLNDEPARAKKVVNDALESLSGARLADDVLEEAWGRLTFTLDPLGDSLRASAEDAIALGLIEHMDLTGIYDLTLLTQVLAAAGLEEVKA